MAILHEALFQRMSIVLQSKQEELHLYGYHDITKEQLWTFCVEKKWRKKNIEHIRPHEMVATILSITPTELLQQTQIQEVIQVKDLADIDDQEMDFLLGRNSE